MTGDLETGSTAHLPRWLRRFASKPAAPIADACATVGSFAFSEKQQLLTLARGALKEAVERHCLPSPNPKNFPANLTEPRGCFVTLTNRSDLRGCIGQVIPQQPLYKAVMQNTQTAALHDSRFEPVCSTELEEIDIELSVLSPLVPLEFSSPEELLKKLQVGRDGVVLRMNGRGATFLPQVWKHYPDKEDFLSRLSQKAGGGPFDWRNRDISVLIYSVQAFSESEIKSYL